MTSFPDDISWPPRAAGCSARLCSEGAILFAADAWGKLAPCGPGASYIPRVRAAFVRRKEEYGMLWPGAVYDGERALADYTRRLTTAAEELGIKLDLRAAPIFSPAEADQWVAESKAAKPDGLVVMVLDRQQHAWPTAVKAVESGIPTVVFSPDRDRVHHQHGTPGRARGLLCLLDR